jgi:glycosyltransferase involved in cell wall biosynthesis
MKPKIIFFAPSLCIGGAERVLVNLLRKIDLKVYEVSLCLLSYKGAYLNEIPREVKVISILKSDFLARSLIYLKRKFNITFPLKFLTQLAVKNTYDVGVSIDGQLTDVLLFVKEKINKKITWVHSCYISEVSLNKNYTPVKVNRLIKKRYDFLDEIIFVSENSKIEFQKLFNASKGVVIYNIIDFNIILEKSKKKLTVKFNENTVNIVAIGRLVKVKEYNKLVDAAHILVEKKLQFKIRIVGNGILMKPLKLQVRNLGLENYIEFLGYISNPYPYLKSSDILVVTSSSEALPTVLLEAMTLEVAIVATNCSGVLEISNNGQCALVTEQTVIDIANKLELMITDDKLRKQYAKQGFERLQFFSEEKNLVKIYNTFK